MIRAAAIVATVPIGAAFLVWAVGMGEGDDRDDGALEEPIDIEVRDAIEETTHD